jgi:COP9 signalosome complex subunit 8
MIHHICHSCNAKFLWKRIPSSVKSDHPELAKIWEVGQALWLRDTPKVFATIESNTWSEDIKPLVDAIKGTFT